MKFHEWGVGVDPDESCWVESVKFNLSFLVVIRVFYELGPPACEEIGLFCSPPDCIIIIIIIIIIVVVVIMIIIMKEFIVHLLQCGHEHSALHCQ